MRRFATSVGLISHQSAKIHINPVWALFPGIPHQRREYISADAIPMYTLCFSLQVAQAQMSGYAADAGVSRTFHCILEHILEPNPQVDAAFSRRMNRCPGYRKALEIHIPFAPLAAPRATIFGATPMTSKPDKPHGDARLPSARTRHTSVARHHNKTSRSPSRRSIPQVPTRDEHQWQHTASTPAIPHLDTRFDELPLETHISGSTPHENQPFPIYMLDFTSALSRRTSVAWQHIKTSFPQLNARFHGEPSDRSQIEVIVRNRVAECGRSSMRSSTQRCEIKRSLVEVSV